MESKHFSHRHNLTIHQMPEGETIDCSGCNLAASGAVYACMQCKFFLHEKCFHATRSINHPSHPLHHLTLVPYPTYPTGYFTCDSCSELGSGFSFTCSTCDFDLHLHCASISQNSTPVDVVPYLESQMAGTTSTEPTAAPTQIQHKSHAEHALNLLPRAPGANGTFICNGCGENGDASVYRCSTCDYDLHVKCAGLNEIADRVDHEHPLTLFYSNPYKGKGVIFECDVCHYNIPSDAWIYCCLECDYGTHVNCVWGKERPKAVVEFEKLLAAQQELSRLQQQIQISRLSAQVIASSINGFRH